MEMAQPITLYSVLYSVLLVCPLTYIGAIAFASARFHASDYIREQSLRRVISIYPVVSQISCTDEPFNRRGSTRSSAARRSGLIIGVVALSGETRERGNFFSVESLQIRPECGAKLLLSQPKSARRKKRCNYRLGGTKLSRFAANCLDHDGASLLWTVQGERERERAVRVYDVVQ